MPRNAIASGAADFVLPAREMSDKIVRLWHNAQKIELPVLPDAPSVEDAAAEAEEALRDILATVRARTCVRFLSACETRADTRDGNRPRRPRLRGPRTVLGPCKLWYERAGPPQRNTGCDFLLHSPPPTPGSDSWLSSC